MSKIFFKIFSWYLVFAMFAIAIIPRVDAGFCPSEGIARSQENRDLDLQKIQNVLETRMVGKRLQELGFSSNEIKEKMSRLDDRQIHQVALKLDELKVGSGGFEVLVVLLLIGILIAVWFQVTGKKVVIQSK
ncbi:MAG: PA2779 family protein [Desulfobacterales bacterium]|nr:PA2779 family protein [Desulfobacterales bacterium]